MKSIVIALICCAGFTWSTAQAAAPKLNVGSMHDYIDSDKCTLLKRVRNSGDATAFVRVEISEIVYGADISCSALLRGAGVMMMALV